MRRYGGAGFWSGLIAFVVIVIAWQLLTLSLFRNSLVVPTPASVIDDLRQHPGIYLTNTWVTAKEAGLGYIYGNGIAVALALIAVLIPATNSLIVRLTLVIYAMPILVVAPILQVTFGGLWPVIVMSALFVVFTTFVAAMVGLAQADVGSLTVVRAAGGSRVDALRKVRLKAWLPSLFGGLAVAAPLAVVGAMVGEYMGSTAGLGIAMVQAQGSMSTARVWGLALVASVISLVAYLCIRLVAHLATPWTRDRLRIATPSSIFPRVPGSPLRRGLVSLGWAMLVTLVLIGAWVAFIRGLNLDPYFAKTPAAVWNYLASDPDASAHRQAVVDALMVTLYQALIGVLVGFVIAVAVACLVRLLPSAEQALSPLLVALSAIPVAAMIPVIAVVVGRGMAAVTIVIALLTFFPTFVNCLIGLRSTPEHARDVVRVSGGSWLRVLRSVDLRFALPSLFASARIAVPGAISGAIVAEWLITGDGLARLMQTSLNNGDFTALWAVGAVSAVCSLIAYGVVACIEGGALRRWGALV